jgi:hypothetical protein
VKKKMRNSKIANETVKKLAALAAGLGIGPLSLRLFTMVGFPAPGPAYDSEAPLARWLASSSITQLCAAALVIGGSVAWLAADVAGPGRARRGSSRSERGQEARASA